MKFHDSLIMVHNVMLDLNYCLKLQQCNWMCWYDEWLNVSMECHELAHR